MLRGIFFFLSDPSAHALEMQIPEVMYLNMNPAKQTMGKEHTLDPPRNSYTNTWKQVQDPGSEPYSEKLPN